MKRTFRVYGAEGHRQRESFAPSMKFTDWYGVEFEVRNADITGANDYTELVVEAETNEAIINGLGGQIDDGVFENSRTGKITEIVNGEEKQISICRHYL